MQSNDSVEKPEDGCGSSSNESTAGILYALGSLNGFLWFHLVLLGRCFCSFMLCCGWCAAIQLNAPWCCVNWAWAVSHLCLNWQHLRTSCQTWLFHRPAEEQTGHKMARDFSLMDFRKQTHFDLWMTNISSVDMAQVCVPIHLSTAPFVAGLNTVQLLSRICWLMTNIYPIMCWAWHTSLHSYCMYRYHSGFQNFHDGNSVFYSLDFIFLILIQNKDLSETGF